MTVSMHALSSYFL